MRKKCFPPVVDARTRVLILGSLPGEQSLAAGRYYANPRNQFWALAGGVIGVDLPGIDYDARLRTLLEHGIGLWDAELGRAWRGDSVGECVSILGGARSIKK